MSYQLIGGKYLHEIELRSQWNIWIDDARHVAFVIAPPSAPQLPVAVDSRSIQELTQSGWGRFDNWEQLSALRRETSPHLEALAGSSGYLEVARGQARRTADAQSENSAGERWRMSKRIDRGYLAHPETNEHPLSNLSNQRARPGLVSSVGPA